MEVYTLDSLYRRESVIDRFDSLIWTERFAAFGDFKLSVPSTTGNRDLLKDGVNLALNESYRVMTVETIENTVADDGTALLTVQGRSLENVLANRFLRPPLTSPPTNENIWTATDTPANVVRLMFDEIVRNGSRNINEKLPLLQPGSIFPASTLPEPVDPITVNLKPTQLYAAMKDICDTYGLGFRLVRNFDTMQLYFDVYAGSDRTSAQTALTPVIFSPEMGNLKNTTELETSALYKNVAYVLSPAGFQVVYSPDVDSTVDGFDRKVLFVEMSDIDVADPDAVNKMIQRGKEELANNNRIAAFDGEINQNSQYKYGVDYNLGDLIEMRNSNGVTNNMQVTEQIFVSDKEGDRSYPTLSLRKFITTGSWLSWDFNQVWYDFVLEEWADLP